MFKVGQKAVCVDKVYWYSDIDYLPMDGPRKNEVNTISSMYIDADGDMLIVFEEHDSNGEGYHSIHFRPLNTDWVEEVLESALVEELELV